jgi:hypothetical protein
VGQAFAIAGIVVLVLLFATAAVAGAMWHRVRQRNEVSIRQPTRPPLRWLGSVGACGRMHRRLRAAVAAMRMAIPAPGRAARRRRRPAEPLSPLVPLADEIEAHAVALDRDLLLADRLRGPTAVSVRQALARQVAEVERLAHRVAAAGMAATGRPGAVPAPEALARIAEHLDALDAARDEIARLEERAGLVSR